MEQKSATPSRILLGIYTVFLLWLLLVRRQYDLSLPYWQHTAAHLNLVPFRTIRHFCRLLSLSGRPELHRIALRNLGGNILLFLPPGWLLPAAFPRLRVLWKTLLTVILVISAVEAAQTLLLVGTCDIDDLILNTAGAAIGYGLYRCFSSVSK